MRLTPALLALTLCSAPALAAPSDEPDAAPAPEAEWTYEEPGAPAPPPPPAAAAPSAAAGDPVPPLVAALKAESPYAADDLIASDPRFARLTAAERARLLENVREGPRWWAPILNAYPGFGLGSLASRDLRGAWLAGSELVGWTLFMVGAVGEMSDEHSHSADATVATAAVLILASRITGVILPFTFPGRRHVEAERALRELPPPVAATPVLIPLAPRPGGPAAALGVALRF